MQDNHAQKIRNILGFLEVSGGLDDLPFPSLKLPSQSNLNGQWSIW
ncbi:hypothetical protein WBP07_27705 [Novosphingobium sp. BL-8A]